jgi:MFS family permease
MILGFSWAGTTYAWASIQIVGLLGISAVFWALFLRIEARVAEPMLDPLVLTNRTFITASVTALMSLFGLTAIMVYYPLFLQSVQSISATSSGKIITPFSVLMSFMGIPAGFLLAKTKRYKWMFIGGYAILAAVMFGTVALTAETAIGWGFVISSMAGIGLGTIPTINALVVQYAVPKRLLGVATGGLYFFVMMGRAIAPAILGSTMNAVYARTLATSLPASLAQSIDQTTLASLGNPRVLLSPPAMADLQRTFNGIGNQGPALFEQTVQAIRYSLESGLRMVFLIGAITMLASFLLILTIPKIPLDVEVPDQ